MTTHSHVRERFDGLLAELVDATRTDAELRASSAPAHVLIDSKSRLQKLRANVAGARTALVEAHERGEVRLRRRTPCLAVESRSSGCEGFVEVAA